MKDRYGAAIVGMACRFPSSPDLAAFWRVLVGGESVVSPVPSDRYSMSDAVAGSVDAATHSGGFIDAPLAFDWRHFGIPPREARAMDPQHRLVLEVAQDALDDAGVVAAELSGSDAGVFIGASGSDHAKLAMRDALAIDGYVTSGTSPAFAANRISHHFDLQGPSIVVDVACASSLVALHQAVRSLECGESSLAIVGGVNLILTPERTLAMAKAGLLSKSGRCSCLGADADGFVRGEGAGVVVLKALRDVTPTDRVYAVVRGTAVGHNGRGEWIMAPNKAAQARLARVALRRAGTRPADVDYAELHGTAFSAGDRVEVDALGSVLSEERDPGRPCRVGSVKSTIGNLEAAAGIASVIKVALSLYHRRLLPTANAAERNAEIDFAAAGIVPQTTSEAFTVCGRNPNATITALSFGGGNAFAVLAGADDAHENAASSDEVAVRRDVLTISGRTPLAVKAFVQRYIELLQADVSAARLARICYASRERRTAWKHRVAVIGSGLAEMRAGLNHLASDPGDGLWMAAGTVSDPDAMAAMTRAWLAGETVSFEALRSDDAKNVALPGYPYARETLALKLRSVREEGAPPSVRSVQSAPSVSREPPSWRAIPARPAARVMVDVTAVRRIVADVLGMDSDGDIPTDARLFTLGVTSISAVRIRERLGELVGRPLPVTVIFDHPEIGKLVRYLNQAGAPATLVVATHSEPARQRGGAEDAQSLAALRESEVEEVLLRRLAELDGTAA